jgi:hypothetical protein
MAIPESQLDTWAKQGLTKQFTDTYATIKSVLEDKSAPFAGRNPQVYLQGSYGNDTNVYGDSDVDIVCCSESSFHFDLDHLTQNEKDNFHRAYPGSGVPHSSFKDDVVAWLKKKYGTDVDPPKKAVHIKATQYRRAADVLVCIEHREYFRFNSIYDEMHYKGVQFFGSDGTAIANFPKIHAENCTAKHQATNGWFKPMVRVLKNMRNRMIDDGKLAEGIAPSYYLEGLLWNVDDKWFGKTYADTFVGCYKWIQAADKTKLLCANQRRWLLRDGKPDSWPPADCATFLNAAANCWDNWR